MAVTDRDLAKVLPAIVETEQAVEWAVRAHRPSFEILGQPVKDD